MTRKNNNSGFTLIDVLVGSFLILIVFLGIFSAFQLGLRILNLSRNKTVATAIAAGEMEKIRNLSYEAVGTIGGQLPFAAGVLEKNSTTSSNNIQYAIERKIKFVVDEADGTGGADSCDWDYKRAEIKISWSGPVPGEVKIAGDIVPKNKVQEIQSCQSQPGGILSVSVFDGYGIPVSFPLVEIFNAATGERTDFYEPSAGSHDFPLAAAGYKIVVSKSGYSREQTYQAGDIYAGKTIAVPERPNPIIIEGQVVGISFSIDKLSSFSVGTFSPQSQDYFSDSFLDEIKISEKSNVIINNGQVQIESFFPGGSGEIPSRETTEKTSSGFLISSAVIPSNLINWYEFSSSDLEPANTEILYQILYFDGTNWLLVPDTSLPGNSSGFGLSPVDLSVLNPAVYSQIKIKGNFLTMEENISPILYDWQISWITSEPAPIPRIIFNLRGNKIVGNDAREEPIYKYSVVVASDNSGNVDIPNLEWDSYNFSVEPASGLSLVNINPAPQPVNLLPGAAFSVALYFKSENSFLLTVQDNDTLEPIFSATARIYNSDLDYDIVQNTNEKGQTYFIPLKSASYNLEVQSPGYSSYSSSFFVSGYVAKTIKLIRIE